MKHFKCPYCDLPSRSDDVVCRRCNGLLRKRDRLEQLVYRANLLRHLIRYREWESTSGGSHMIRQAEFIVTAVCDWTGSDELRELALLPLRRELTTVLFSQIKSWKQCLSIGRACADIFVGTEKEHLVEKLNRIDGFLASLDDAERKLNDGAVEEGQLQKWFLQQAKKAGLTAEAAVAHAFATLERWPQLLQQLNPAEYKKHRTELLFAKARSALKRKDYDLASQRYQEILDAEPNCIQAYEGLANLSAKRGNFAAAIVAFERAIQLGTSNTFTYNNFAWYVATGEIQDRHRLQRASLAARHAVEETPVGSYLDTLAEVLFSLGLIDDAIAVTRQGIDEAPDKTLMRERLLLLCAARDRTRSAAAGTLVGRAADSEIDEDAESEFDESVGSFSDDADSGIVTGESSDEEEQRTRGPQSGTEVVEEYAEEYELAEAGDAGVFIESPEVEAHMDADNIEADEVERAVDFAEEELEVFDESDASPPRMTRPDARTKSDVVNFSVTSPTTMVHDEHYVVEVWAHLAAEKDAVLSAAREMSGGTVDHRMKAGVSVEQGAVLAVQISIPRLIVEDPCDQIIWTGEMANATFPVYVPEDVKPGSIAGTAVIHSSGIALAKVHFVLRVGREESKSPAQSEPGRCFRTAFASYASKDRDAVLGRLQGIQKGLPQLDVFVDVAKLRSGADWADRISSEIRERDVFYLFWSKAASESEWVEREWKIALTHKGISCIDPVPLVSPEKVPPPAELASVLHFNDWMLAFMRDS